MLRRWRRTINEVEPQTVEAVLVQVADALSGARPGALAASRWSSTSSASATSKSIATRHEGVDKVYAMQAAAQIGDGLSRAVPTTTAPCSSARDRARDQELEYLGQIKVVADRGWRCQ